MSDAPLHPDNELVDLVEQEHTECNGCVFNYPVGRDAECIRPKGFRTCTRHGRYFIYLEKVQ